MRWQKYSDSANYKTYCLVFIYLKYLQKESPATTRVKRGFVLMIFGFYFSIRIL